MPIVSIFRPFRALVVDVLFDGLGPSLAYFALSGLFFDLTLPSGLAFWFICKYTNPFSWLKTSIA